MFFKHWPSKLIKMATPCPGCDEFVEIEESVAGDSDDFDLKTAVRNWRMCRDLADRYNRYLVQYGAAAATALGIAAATGGLFATADAVRGNAGKAPIDEAISNLIWGLMGVSFVIFVSSGLLLVLAFGIRERAEKRAAQHLHRLIGLKPEPFFPKSEDQSP